MTKKEKYQDRTINDEIEKKINTFNKTRNNRLEMSKRLAKYDDTWKVIFFCLNIEAVIFILLSLSEVKVENLFTDAGFTFFSGVFSIYVILLQYYINSLNYKERALRMHYHQLDIEDLILRLKSIFLKKKDTEFTINDSEIIKEYQIIMFEYQAILKNNENHSLIDNKLNEFYEFNCYKNNDEDKDSAKEEKAITQVKSEWKKCNWMQKILKPRDLTIDNQVLTINIIFVLGLLIILLIVLTSIL